MVPIATRRERVVLELQDRFSAETLRAAAAAKTLDKSLDSVDRTSVRASKGIDSTGRSSARVSKDIDRLSGRLVLFRDIGLTLGPALAPISAIAIPAVTTLASQLGAAAIAGGTMVVAFQGVGTALEAVNKAALEPTADNLRGAELAMSSLAPEAARFVAQIQDMRPAFTALRDAAAGGLFPGLSAALAEAEGAFDRVETVLYAVGDAAGDLAEDFAEGLAGPRGQEFLDFIAAEVPGALTDLGHTVGNLAAGMAELWMAFTPLNRGASDWLLEASRGFDEWASGLASTDGFRDFVDYIRENGPRVADALGALGNAFVQIVTAVAPLGGPSLAAIKAFADVVAAIAGSPAGPALFALAGGLALVSRSLKTITAIKASSFFTSFVAPVDGATRSLTGMQRAAVGAVAALGGLMVVDALQGGLKDYSVGVEEVTKAILDMNAATDSELPSNLEGLERSIERLANPNFAEGLQDSISNMLGGIGNEEEYDKAVAQIDAVEQALVGLVQSGNAAAAQDWLEGLGLSDSQMKMFLSQMPEYREALVGVENQARLTGEGIEEGFDRGISAAQRFQTAVADLNRMLEGRASLRDYEAALDDFTKGLKENGRSFDINTAKGRLNQENLDNIAGTMGRVVEGLKRSDRQPALRQARQDIRDLREAGQLSEAQMRFLLGEIKKLDDASAKPKVDIDTAGVAGAIAGVNAALNGIQDETVYINVARRGPAAGAALGVKGSASGENYIPGQRWPYGDKVLRAVAPGEAIITNRNGEADANRDLIRAMNAGVDVARQMSAGSRSAGSSRPVVNVGGTTVGGANVRVFIDGREVRAIVRSEQSNQREFDRRLDDRE